MEDHTNLDDNISVRSGSVGCRSPPSLSPVVSLPTSGSPASPPPPLLAAPHISMSGPSPPGHHTPSMFPSPPPANRPPFLPALYFSHAYSSPPQIQTSDPTANDCKLIDIRGQKLAAFVINGDSMLCLPQAFELFLKNLVGGLHTVYTKLKRLGIEPVVCNVEQVRVLRGLGAIQPGVNRCKLLSVKHFEILYKDCTTARRRDRLSSLLHDRPGRPPKRPHELMGLSIPGHLHPGALPPHPLNPEAIMALKKSRMEGRDFAFMNGGSMPHVNCSRQLLLEADIEKSPLLSNGYNPPPKALMAQYMALNGSLPHPALFAHSGLPMPAHPGTPWPQPSDHGFKGPQPQDNIARNMVWESCKASYDEFLKNLERIREERRKIERDTNNIDIQNENSPQRTNGYSYETGYDDNDVLNLSKSESRDDLSEAGQMANDSETSSRGHHDEKEEVISDTEDFEDKNELSDHEEEYEYQHRHIHSPLSSLRTQNNNNINTSNSLLNSVNSLSKGLVDNISAQNFNNNLPNTSSSSHINVGDSLPTGLNGTLLNVNTNLVSSSNGIPVSGYDRAHPTDVITMGSAGSPSAASTPIGSSTPQQSSSSLETLLSKIQNLLKVAAESFRHEEKTWSREKEHLRVEFMRQKDMRERLEKQMAREEKVKVIYLRKLKKEKRTRRRLEDELSDKSKKLSQYESTQKELLCLRTENVKNAITAMSAANCVTTASMSPGVPSSGSCSRIYTSTSIHEPTSHLSPKTSSDDPINSSAQNETQPLFYSKPMLFNCSV